MVPLFPRPTRAGSIYRLGFSVGDPPNLMGTRVNPVRLSQSKASSGAFCGGIDYMARRSYWSDKKSMNLYSVFLCYGNDVLDICML